MAGARALRGRLQIMLCAFSRAFAASLRARAQQRHERLSVAARISRRDLRRRPAHVGAVGAHGPAIPESVSEPTGGKRIAARTASVSAFAAQLDELRELIVQTDRADPGQSTPPVSRLHHQARTFRSRGIFIPHKARVARACQKAHRAHYPIVCRHHIRLRSPAAPALHHEYAHRCRPTPVRLALRRRRASCTRRRRRR